MGTFNKITIVSLCSCLFLTTSWAQQTGEIRGKVTEEMGEALAGVAVTARGPNLQGLRTTVTDEAGAFRIPLLPVGAYALTFELPGFEKLKLTENQVRLGFTLNLAIVLRPGKVQEEVVVVTANPLIDTTRTDASHRLNSDALDLAPTQARTVAEIVSLTPGVTGVRTNTVTGGANANWITDMTAESGLPGFRGEGSGANNWLVDGLSIKGVAYGEPGVSVNYDAWEEVQIVSDGFSPELGQGVGGFVNIVTRSGGNAFHGQVGGLFRPSGLRAPRKPQMSATSVPETSLLQTFGNLGGPFFKDKLWFFLSDDLHASSDVTSENTMVWLTVPGGERRTAANNVFGKVTLTPLEGHTLSLGGTLDDLLRDKGGIGFPETYAASDSHRRSYRLNYRGVLSPNTFLTAAWGQNRNETEVQPRSGDFGPPAYHWQDIGQVTNNTDFGRVSLDRRTDFAVGLSHFLDLERGGDHEIKMGASYYGYRIKESYHWTGLDADLWLGDGFDNGVGISWAGPGVPLSLWESAVGEADNRTRGFGFYAEDSVVLGRVSVMAGLRTDTQQVFNDTGAKAWSWGMGDFLQPRVTIAWDLIGDGRNVLKFGYGLYAMPVTTSSLPFVNTRPLFARRFYRWIGPSPVDPSDARLSNPDNWLLDWEQIAPREVDPALKPNKINRFLLEFDRSLGPNWALKVRGISSHSKNLINPVSLYDPSAPLQMKRLLTNFELKRRDYRALEVEVNGRIPGRLALNASWTWSRARGTASGDFFEAISWDIYAGGLYDSSIFGYHPLMPEESPFYAFYEWLFKGLGGRGIGDEGWYGPLPYSVDHVVKLVATYLAPFGINVSTDLEYLSGYHWEMKGWSNAAGFYATFPEGRGVRTTPAHLYVDLLAERDFRLSRGLVLGVGINAANLLNSQRPVSYFKNGEGPDETLNPQFGQVWARQLPRWIQLKFTLGF